MKQVVINKESSFLLKPYWMDKLLKRKGIIAYFYEEIRNDNFDVISHKLLSVEELKEKTRDSIWCHIDVINQSLGSSVEVEKFKQIANDNFIDYHEIWNNREDKDLIEIVKEINNENIIKVINIPDDVNYEILEYECSLGEYIGEKRRIWE